MRSFYEVALLLLCALALAAQPLKVSVATKDADGNVVPAVQVQLKNDKGVVASSETDAAGQATFMDLQPGHYVVAVRKDGFEPVGHPFDLTAAGAATIDITMALHQERHDSVEVKDTVSPVSEGASGSTQISADEAKELPSRPATLADALPLVPGVLRTPEGSLKMSGAPEHRSALIVNSADVTDPATGQFGPTIPIDIVETVNVFQTPFLAQYGKFTSGLVSVETKRGGDKWKFDLNDPFPDFRFRSWHLSGIRDATPRVNFSGPLIKEKFYLSEGFEYEVRKTPIYTLPYPYNQKQVQGFNSFTQADYIVSPTQLLTATFHVAPQRFDYPTLNYFNPEQTQPSSSAHDYTGTVADRLTLKGGLLENTFSVTRFTADVWAQGSQDMTLSPLVNSGNYFAQQTRGASRVEGMSTWSPAPINGWGVHNIKLGTGIAHSDDDGEFTARPVNIVDANNVLLQRISFTGGTPFDRSDIETSAFAQDHWLVTPKLAIDYGLRVESQEVTETLRTAPRFGVAWTPFRSTNTVIRAGWGLFYDRVPLNVYAFSQYPEQVVTNYAPDGSVLGVPLTYQNILGTVVQKFSFVSKKLVSGNFAPRSSTWNVQIEQPVGQILKLRVGYLQNKSSDLIVMNPAVDPTATNAAMVLSGVGAASYSQFETTARVRVGENRELFFSYVHSTARGDLNDFNDYLGSFPFPVVRTNQYANLSSNMPNRFLAWGLVHLPWKMRIAPIFEYRSGFPFSATDPLQQYVGVANSLRYPNFLSLDARISKDFKVNPKYSIRLSFSCFNATNHWNPDSVFSNIDNPQYGVFFGQHKRRYTADFDIIF
jgi:hypothetical protein